MPGESPIATTNTSSRSSCPACWRMVFRQSLAFHRNSGNFLNMENFSFSKVRYADLQALVDLREEVDDSKFEDWINDSSMKTTEADVKFLEGLITKNRKNIESYSEEEVKAKFIIPILNRIDFSFAGINDWYERTLRKDFNGTTLGGTVDYLVAAGEKEPVRPYFFLQEFKPEVTNKNPEVQLVAEMLVAFPENESGDDSMKGAYLVGTIWRFVILQKMTDQSFCYYVSRKFDALVIEEAEVIYNALMKLKKSLTN